MAATYFSPKRLFMKHEMEQFKLSAVGKHATQQEWMTQRNFLKQQFLVSPQDVMDVYKKATREKMASSIKACYQVGVPTRRLKGL
jgi:hypothetical protein